MICMYCEEKVSRGPDVVGGHGEYAHLRCVEEAERRQRERDAQSEITHLRARVRELEARRAATAQPRAVDPNDPDGGEDDLHCPHRGRIRAYYNAMRDVTDDGRHRR